LSHRKACKILKSESPAIPAEGNIGGSCEITVAALLAAKSISQRRRWYKASLCTTDSRIATKDTYSTWRPIGNSLEEPVWGYAKKDGSSSGKVAHTIFTAANGAAQPGAERH